MLHTSHHTHYVIGSGANDPQKYDPDASRETLDHSIPYIFTVALQDGAWHHADSYSSERAHRPDTVALWQKVTTVEDEEWTRRKHEWLPSAADRDYLLSIMNAPIYEPARFANYIAPPARGINRKPMDFEYVRTES